MEKSKYKAFYKAGTVIFSESLRMDSDTGGAFSFPWPFTESGVQVIDKAMVRKA